MWNSHQHTVSVVEKAAGVRKELQFVRWVKGGGVRFFHDGFQALRHLRDGLQVPRHLLIKLDMVFLVASSALFLHSLDFFEMAKIGLGLLKTLKQVLGHLPLCTFIHLNLIFQLSNLVHGVLDIFLILNATS